MAVIVLAAAVFRLSPLWPGPGLPAGATRLHIATAAPHIVPNLGCPTALLGAVRVATDGKDLIFISIETDEPVQVVWPSGWAAWLVGGRAELVDRDGSTIAHEGEVIPARYGGGEAADGAFHVCMGGD